MWGNLFEYFPAKAIVFCLVLASIECEGTLEEKRSDGEQDYEYISLLPPDDEAWEEYSGQGERTDPSNYDLIKKTRNLKGRLQLDNSSKTLEEEIEENEKIYQFFGISPDARHTDQYTDYAYYDDEVTESTPTVSSVPTVISQDTEGDAADNAVTTPERETEKVISDILTATVSITTEGEALEEDDLGIDINKQLDLGKTTVVEKSTNSNIAPYYTKRYNTTTQYNTIQPTTILKESSPTVTKEVFPTTTETTSMLLTASTTEQEPRKKVKIASTTTTESADFDIEVDRSTPFSTTDYLQSNQNYITAKSMDTTRVWDIVGKTEPVLDNADVRTTFRSTAKQHEYSTSQYKTSEQTLVLQSQTTVADYEISSRPQLTTIFTTSYVKPKLPYLTEGLPEVKSKPSMRSSVPLTPFTEEISILSLTTLADKITAEGNETSTSSGSVADREAARISDFSTLILIICLISVAIVFVFVIVVIVLVHTRLRRRGKYAIAAESDSGNSCDGRIAVENGKSGAQDRRTEAVVPVHYNDSVA